MARLTQEQADWLLADANPDGPRWWVRGFFPCWCPTQRDVESIHTPPCAEQNALIGELRQEQMNAALDARPADWPEPVRPPGL